MRPFQVFLAVIVSAPVALASQVLDPLMDYTLPAQSGGTLTIDLDSGGVLVIRGWNEPRVLVRARLGGKDWRATRVSLTPAPKGARFETSLEGSRDELTTSHQFEIRVPRRHDLEIRSAGGDIRIAYVEGEFTGRTDGGSIVLVNVQGQAKLATRGGNVEIGDSHLDGRVTTRGGAVRLSRVTGGVQATRDVSEDLEPKKPDVRRMDLRGGPIEIDDAPKGAILRTGAGRIAVHRSGGALDVNTGYGDIEVGATLGAVRAVTGTGDIRVTIARNLTDAETVDLTSGLGKVTLELPPDFDGALDLRTGYTESFGRPTRIQCDWNLKVERTGLIANGGTPQHYVIGRGTAGKGACRVIVRTTNGDIVIKRSRRSGVTSKIEALLGGTWLWLPSSYRSGLEVC